MVQNGNFQIISDTFSAPGRPKAAAGQYRARKKGEPVECRARGVVHNHENPRPPDRQGRKGGRRPELHRGPRMLQVIFSFFPEGRESFALMSRCRADPPPTTGAQRLGPRSNSGRGEGLQASAAPMGLRRPHHFEIAVKITRALRTEVEVTSAARPFVHFLSRRRSPL